jgi:hypothetical protein
VGRRGQREGHGAGGLSDTGAHGQNAFMRIKLIEELPMGTSAELYQLSWVIEQLLADPRRIVQVRSQLHTGQQVQYFHWAQGKLRWARVVGMHADHVTVQDAGYSKAFKVHYAAILTEPATAPNDAPNDAPIDASPTPADVELTRPAPPPEVAARADFRVGLIVRVNQHTATLDCDGQKWRVAFELLRHLVDV